LLASTPAARPGPSAPDALAGGGGIVVAIGALMVALDVFGEDTNETGAALVMLALFAVGFAGLVLAPPPTHPAWIAATAIAAPAIFVFLFLPEADDVGDLRPFFVCTVAAWAACYLVPHTRGRPVYVALALLTIWLWVVAEITGPDSYGAAPVPSPPYLTPAEYVGALQGDADADVASARPAQVSLDDLDSDDPLYPLAQDCDDGDDEACDRLWAESPIGSDFEEFGRSCGGRDDDGFGGACNGEFTPPDLDDFGDPFDDGGDDFEAPLPLDGAGLLGGDDDESAEVGVVSLLFAAVYLGALWALDARGNARLATALVVPGVVTLVAAVGALGDASGEALVGGSLAVVAGLVLAALGHASTRRFTTWAGGALASVGALVIAGELSGLANTFESDDPDPDLLGSGLVTALFGLGLVALAFGAARFVASRPARPAPPPRSEPPGWSAPPPPPPPFEP
jgi:hypothetical protein